MENIQTQYYKFKTKAISRDLQYSDLCSLRFFSCEFL